MSALHDRSGLQWPPGFAVFFVFVAGFTGDVGVETEALAASGGFDGDDVPDFLGDDVGDDEIDFVLGVNVATSPATVCTYLVDAAFGGASGLHLDAPQAAVPAQDEVEALAVSVGLGDSEAHAGCLAHEGELGDFSLAFAGGRFVVAARYSGFPGVKFGLLFHGRVRKGAGCA